jgi:uncharacterized membrane protein
MDKKLYWAAFSASVVGLLVSIYMTIFKLTNNDAMCLGSGGCSFVNASRYSEINGFPVAAIGMIGFLALMVVMLLEGRLEFFADNGPARIRDVLDGRLVFHLLPYLEIYVIRHWCPFCVTSAIAITLVFIFSTIRMVQQLRNS